MNNKRTGAIIIIAIVMASVCLILWTPAPEEEIIVEEVDVEIEFHSFNRLNWWDIAWNLSQPADFDNAISQLAIYGPRVVTTSGHDRAVTYFQE